jgi:hypothetical protein
VPTYSLEKGSTQSCGCLKVERYGCNMEKAIEKHLKIHIVEGTNIPVITRKKLKRNNKSGVTGVQWDKARERWVAVIRFQNQVHFLGRYKNKEDAIRAREEAKGKYHNRFLKKFNSND